MTLRNPTAKPPNRIAPPTTPLATVLLISLLLACIGLFAVPPPSSAAESPWTREAISAWLRHQERLVRSARCRFERITPPTPPDRIPLIRQVCQAIGEIGEAEVQSYIYTQQEADTQRNFLIQWLRKGSMERWDMTRKIDTGSPDTAKGPANTLAFDGHLFRSLARRGSATIGEIKTIEQSGWAAMNRVDPFAFLYEYNTMPYSQIVAQGRDLQISTVVKNNRQLTRVSLRHPQFDWRGFVLFFDQDRRLVERQLIRYENSVPRIIQTHTFSDYTEHQDSSGETIWFPHKALWHYYMGSLPDGTLVENTTDILILQRYEGSS